MTTFQVEDPADLTVIGEVADGTAADARAAVDAAAAAFPAWSRTAPRKRSELLHKVFELMHRDRTPLAALISAENGKSEADALAEVTYAAEFFRWYAEEAVRPGGDYGSAPAGGVRTVVTHKPIGVAALVTPWNFPAAMATRKIAPALAAGCTAVLKPAAETPLTALAVARLLTEAGVPDGVLTVVPTTDAAGVVSTWLADSRVRVLSFTGSTAVGKALLRQAADRVVVTAMELGGNAPFVVTEDADLEQAVAGAMIAKFRNGGQACTAANRFYVHEAVADRFTELFGRAVEKLAVGPYADGAQIGPLISGTAVARVTRVVGAAVAGGARITHQATVPAAAGYFYPPTVLRDVADDSELFTEEIFGPVAAIATWSDDAELIARVNDTEYGLAGYVYAGELQRAIRIGEALDVGMVGVNRGLVSDPAAPFGGVKQSGLGREGARDGLREYSETQYLSIDWA
ncbi:NAD-dependent succinate-semialdehyde dehydrogenase [Kribbella sandramycini]|uniref:NAD-dependent succinate-semialdehyde dehydrogenase n=1 Tax=Kribbella sandramycini TaxID=60450 RepID=A0A7Y4L586_9ACTN|nr:NAD-dependent succinate-semialdehyde dehydrogenase [Kribbella sandramycini]MBB6570990.1 succinate-semialdehyde dehydrogenase/glutarate-semialdehyde dehydrogenase [Kribbella sandramycini]NOL43601.1 NAD-dependent succinate-semialdehyde dehydrogenase [Kribbella sandramycini]